MNKFKPNDFIKCKKRNFVLKILKEPKNNKYYRSDCYFLKYCHDYGSTPKDTETTAIIEVIDSLYVKIGSSELSNLAKILYE
jgi:hypothetical protein